MTRKKPKVTMAHIADNLNISKMTVSRALKNKDGISEKMRLKVIKKAQELGYEGDKNSTNTFSEKRKILLVANKLILELGEDFYTRLLKKLTQKLEEDAFQIIFLIVSESSNIKSLIPPDISGAILLGEFSKDFFKTYNNFKLPTIIIDSEYQGKYSSISTNNFSSAIKGVDYLYKKGHKNIIFLGDKDKTKNYLERYSGYRMYLEQKKLPIQDIKNTKGVTRLIEDGFTACFCATDLLAFELIRDLKEENVLVPRDFSVIGFDNTFYSKISRPEITTMNVNLDLFSSRAISLLKDTMDNKNHYIEAISLMSEICKRDSVASLNIIKYDT